MDFYFVYSSGGGGGDWNGIDRIWATDAPKEFKENILIKFGDIFFNHKGLKTILKPNNWKKIDNAKDWLYGNTNDKIIYKNKSLILDVGTTKIVNYINAHHHDFLAEEIINKFDEILKENKILEKYADFIVKSDIHNAITFDIPNPFKIRNQQGSVKRNIFFEKHIKVLLTDKCVEYANKTYELLGNDAKRLLTILPAFLSEEEIKNYLQRLNYTPTKLSIGALIDLNDDDFRNEIEKLNRILDFSKYEKVHLLGCGGIKKVNIIKDVIGNFKNVSVDNTTAYNRSIDGNTKGTSFSKYYDYTSKKMCNITEENLDFILDLHSKSKYTHYSRKEMEEILKAIIIFQNGKSPSSKFSYDNRAKLILHNFDVYRENAK